MKKIFISYSQSDDSFQIDELVNILEANSYSVIWDKGIIEFGDSQIDKIKNGIQECDYVLSILTRNSYKRPWIIRELHEAVLQEKLKCHKVLIPIIIGNLSREEIASVDTYFGWLRTDPYFLILKDGNDLEVLMQKLSEIKHTPIKEHNYSILPILENNLEVYRTSNLINFGISEKQKYIRTVDSYILVGFDKGVEFKHFVKCDEKSRYKMKAILDQYGERICVTGSGEALPPNKWLVWFLDLKYDVTSKTSDPLCNNTYEIE